MTNDSRSRVLGWYRLGLRTNPFFHTTLDHRQNPGEGSHLARKLLAQSWRAVEVTGHSGSGKTHLARWLCQAFQARGTSCSYQHLALPSPVPVPGNSLEIFFLDEAQRASPQDLFQVGEWLRAVPARRFLATTHGPVVAHLGPIETRREILEGLDRADLEAYLKDRLESAALPNREPQFSVTRPAWEALLELSQGNFLRFTDLLYQACQQPPEQGALGAEAVESAARGLPAWEPGDLH